MAKKEEIKIIEKLTRAKVKLEAMLKKHSDNCMIEMDPGYHGPCTCGAGEHNKRIEAVIAELSFD